MTPGGLLVFVARTVSHVMSPKLFHAKGAPMSKTDSTMDNLRHDLIRWKSELPRLKAMGRDDIVAVVEVWILEAERVICHPSGSTTTLRDRQLASRNRRT